jgi:Protein of unknown function (DUF4012)
VRRLLMLLLFGLVVVGGAAFTWTAMGQAKAVEDDLAATRSLLAQAGGFQNRPLGERLALIDQAGGYARAADARLRRWPLRQLGAVPVVGRDVRVARAVAASATRTVQVTHRVVRALEPLESPPTKATIVRAADALLAMHRTLELDVERVRSTRALVTGSARARYLETAGEASQAARRGGAGLKLASGLWGAPGSTRWFLAFQNPAELRGTGGLIGEYGILESSEEGPRLTTVAHYQDLDVRTRTGVRLPRQLAGRYARFAVDRAWSAVNIPPDMPTVGRIITELYEQTTGDRIDGVIAADPLAVAQVLRISGPIQAGGLQLSAGNVADETLVKAYIRYANDNPGRRRFLEEVARATFAAFQAGLESRPQELLRALGDAAHGKHVQVYSRDPASQRTLLDLGLSGSATAPTGSDYLMPVGVNAGGNKLDAYLHRRLDWRVRLAADGSATANASLVLRNAVPAAGLPRYVVGPFDGRFRAGVNEQVQSMYVAGGYSFTKASLNGRPVAAEAQADLGGLVLTQSLGVPAGASATLAYELTRPDAVERLGDDRLRYRLLLRPQATARPDQARIVVDAPKGWRFDVLPRQEPEAACALVRSRQVVGASARRRPRSWA